MNSFLIVAGIAIILFSLWHDRLREDKQKQELEDYRKLKADIATAKSDVTALLNQLEVVSERIVEEVSLGLEELQTASNSGVKRLLEQQSSLQQTATTQESYQISAEAESSRIDERISPAKSVNNKTIAFPIKSDTSNDVNAKSTAQPQPQPVPPKNQMVYAMTEMGYSEEEIAKQMKMGKGEVRLMLRLKRKGEEINA